MAGTGSRKLNVEAALAESRPRRKFDCRYVDLCRPISVSIFGTVNLEVGSLRLFVYEPRFGEALRALQQSYVEHSVRLNPAVWATRAFKERFVENALRLVSPLL